MPNPQADANKRTSVCSNLHSLQWMLKPVQADANKRTKDEGLVYLRVQTPEHERQLLNEHFLLPNRWYDFNQ